MDYTCAECGLPFDAERKRLYCTPACKTACYNRRAREKAITVATIACKTCGIEVTFDPRRVKGKRYCSPKCRPDERGTIQKACARCDTTFTTRRHACAPKLCPACRPRTTAQIRRARCEDKLRRAALGTVGSEGRIYIAGNCAVCSTPYCQRATGNNCTRTYRRWCSAECRAKYIDSVERAAKRRSKANRRARKRNAFVATVNPMAVFQADGWKCHLCGKAVKRDAEVPHPQAPTVDHVIPLAKGGTHEPANCRTACFLCNALKGDRGGGQLLLMS